jgi:hypothetical protein
MNLANNILFNKERLNENIAYMNEFFLKHEMNWTFVIKAFHDFPTNFIEALSDSPCRSIASDNKEHLKIIKGRNTNMETWFLNYNGIHVTQDYIDVNLTHLNDSASDRACFMISIDPEREGLAFNQEYSYKKVGAYLNCEKLPNVSFFDSWSKLNIPPDVMQSLGTSISFESIDFLKSKGVNHYRLGEILLTGKSVINGSKIKGLRQDVFDAKQNVSYHLISQLYS